MSANHHLRKDAERRLGLQAEILASTKHLIEARVSLDQWPATELASFRQALYPTRGNEFELRKARSLARHLFRGRGMPDFPGCEPIPHGDLGERLRADLPGLLKLGAGVYMTSFAISTEPKTPEVAPIPRRL